MLRCVRSKPSLIKLAGHEPLKRRRTINKQACSVLLYTFLPLPSPTHLCPTTWWVYSTQRVQHLVTAGFQLEADTEPLSACVWIVQQGAHPETGLDRLPWETDTHHIRIKCCCFFVFFLNLKWHSASNINVFIIMHKQGSRDVLWDCRCNTGHQQGRWMLWGLADGDRVYLRQAGIWNLITRVPGEEVQPQMSR